MADGRVRTYRSTIPSLPILPLLDLHFFVSRLERMSADFTADRPDLAPDAQALDSMTVGGPSTLFTQTCFITDSNAARSLLNSKSTTPESTKSESEDF